MRLIIIKKKYIFIVALLFTCLICFHFLFPVVFAVSPKHTYTVVIDAGHGGIDGGSVGISTGNAERELNLYYAESLKKYLEAYGINVVMTRSNMNGLYSPLSQNRKQDDMKARKAIIDSSGADIVVSIHMNSFPSKSSRGAQVFYKDEDDVSKHLAESIQSIFVRDLEYARKEPQKGDYYILNCSEKPSAIIECGFLSNSEDDILLGTEDYKNKICYAIFCGIIKYLYSEIT